MRITVLGKSPAWQDADGACSGYLVEGGGQTVLLDCGPGRVRQAAPLRRLRGRRRGGDHPPARRPHPRSRPVRLRAALRAAPAASVDGPAPTPLRLFAPPGALEAFAGMCTATGMTADHIELAFDVTIYDPADTLALGGLDRALPARPALHPRQRRRVRRATARGSRSRADCGPNEELCDVRRGHRPAADRGDAAAPERDGERGHLTPARGGRARREGGREAAGADALLRRARRRLGARRGRARLRRAGRRRPRRCDVRARRSKDCRPLAADL